MLDVARQVHGGHAANADLTLDVVAASEDGGEMLFGFHGLDVGRGMGDVGCGMWGAVSSTTVLEADMPVNGPPVLRHELSQQLPAPLYIRAQPATCPCETLSVVS